MTNQQGAPEALTVVAPTKAQIIEGLRAVQSSIGWRRPHILDQPECTHWDYIDAACAALVEAQQPVAHVQNPAEIEHVAGDVSKNGPESNMAQQPAPSAAADLHPKTADLVQRFAAALADKLAAAEKKYGYSDGWASPDWMDECRLCLREHLFKGDPRDVAAYCAFLWHHGESTALPSEVVEDRVKEFERLFPAPKPSPTPQADSQPAPVGADVMRLDPSQPLHVNLAHLAKSPKAAIEAFGAEWAGWCAASAIDALRAARAPADSVTAPAGGLGWKLVPMEITDAMRNAAAHAGMEALDLRDAGASNVGLVPKMYEAMLAAAPTQPAQAADSVLEDAARWRAWANAMVEACNHSGSEEPPFLEALGNAIGDAEPPITLDQLNAWTDAALAAQREVKP